MAKYVTDPIEVLDYVHDTLDQNKGPLGLAFAGYGEDRLIPRYPAILVNTGPLTREWHTTHRWQLTIMLEMFVYHANLEGDRRVRTREDLQLVANVRAHLHDPTQRRLRNSVGEAQAVESFINAEDPVTIGRLRGDQVIGTRLEYTVISQETFK